MSAGHAPLLEALAFRLVAALETYEAHVATLVDEWPSPLNYAPVSRTMDEMRALTAGIPELAVPFVSLLIGQAELMNALFQSQSGSGTAGIAPVRERLTGAIGALRARCLGLIRRH
jgi:hypothetical protein